MPELRRSALHDRHVALGAKLSDFGGWEMPISYAGVLAEHAAVREAVGVFDVSHLGKASVRGPGAAAFVNRCLTNDLARIGPGRAQYTLCCSATGGVVDDLIVYLHGPEEVFLVPNAANTSEVVRRLHEAAPVGVSVDNEHDRYAVIAVQGPRADDLLAALEIPVAPEYMSFVVTERGGLPLVVCRSGYTGERGYELIAPWDAAGELWDRLLATGRALGAQPCGLGARDTLRTEMGYPLHGQDLTPDISPVQARCGWAVGWAKPEFWGRAALVAERAAGPERLLQGLVAADRGIPRPHALVASADGTAVGEVTSGTFSPTRRVGIGLALLNRSVADGDTVHIDIRGRTCAAVVTRPPFVDASPR